MRIALVHDWLTGMRGGERVLEALIELMPGADLYTLLHVPGSVSASIDERVHATSFIQHVPGAARHYRKLLPLFPTAIERLDLRGYDLIVSSSHCVAKSVHARGAVHVCYCHTPMRYVWDQYDAYVGATRGGALLRVLGAPAAAYLRAWDRRTAQRVDRFVANSAHVRSRIRHAYARDAGVVHPPVDVARFAPAAARDDAYVCAGALVPYKRVDLAIAAFNRSGRPLLVVGDGPEYRRLRALARRNVVFAGHVPDAELAAILGRARALVMPMVEDFGIIAVEAQAAGTPVIALRAGGALESVIPFESAVADTERNADAGSATGLFFDAQQPDSLRAAVELRERLEFRVPALCTHAARFAPHVFRDAMARTLEDALGTALPAPRRPPAPAVAS
jgi:glycosyltransferase involved in cell wall biosynthesis